jgi:hypothetical protein
MILGVLDLYIFFRAAEVVGAEDSVLLHVISKVCENVLS